MSETIALKTVCGPEDIETVAALAREIWTQHYTPIIGAEQVAYMLERFQSHEAIDADVSGGYVYTIAYWGGEPCGYCAARLDADALFLSKLYVREAQRGKGIARAMLYGAEATAYNAGAARIRLTCNKHNAGSLAAYERLGFARAAEAVTDIGDGFVMDDFVMEKRLAGGDGDAER